ncbi:MAG: response regulator [Silvanigrellaceae bacterium]
MTSASEAEQPRILVIDDEVELRTLLAMKFSKSGFEVDVAASGEEAVEFIQKENYRAILCDLSLPNSLKGHDVYQLVLRKNSKAKFIAITGYAQDSPEVGAAKNAGIEHIFSKPLRMSAILNILNSSA